RAGDREFTRYNKIAVPTAPSPMVTWSASSSSARERLPNMNEELDEKVGPKIIKSGAKRTWGGARPDTGGRRPGSGRKMGTPNKATAEIKELAQKYGPEAIAELARLATKAESEAARVAAIRELLDRGYGRAVQPIVGSVTYGVSQPCGNANSHL